MADEDEEAETEEPAVELGEGADVEGAPVARVASRLHWGIERSEVAAREGDTVVRTSEGPRRLDAILEEVDETYFDSRQRFVGAVRGVIGYGPVPTGEDGHDAALAEDGSEAGDADEGHEAALAEDEGERADEGGGGRADEGDGENAGGGDANADERGGESDGADADGGGQDADGA